MSNLSNKERVQLRDFRHLSKVVARSGIEVRREKLARGHSYRVKSGDCVFSGQNLVFIDQRLPITQQLTLLIDYLLDKKLPLESEEIAELSSPTRSALQPVQVTAAGVGETASAAVEERDCEARIPAEVRAQDTV